MSTQTLTTDGATFRVETDQIDITTNMPEPDPNWSFTDSHGHKHRWQNLKRNGSWIDGGELPTLRWVDDEPYWCAEHSEFHETGHYECVKCGDEIEPGRRPPPAIRRMMPGMRSYFIDDREVDEDEFNREVEKARAEA